MVEQNANIPAVLWEVSFTLTQDENKGTISEFYISEEAAVARVRTNFELMHSVLVVEWHYSVNGETGEVSREFAGHLDLSDRLN